MDVPQKQSGVSVALMAWLGATCYWAALPPLGWSGVGWFALLPWSLIVTVPRPLSRREWLAISSAAWALWLGLLYFIPIPHPALWLLWPLLAGYCGVYVLAFIVSARWFQRTVGLPVWLAVPICWAGLEWVRGNFLTGFGMAYLSHSQYRQPLVLQVANLGGAYLLSFVLALSAALIAIGISAEYQLRAGRAATSRGLLVRKLVASLIALASLFLVVCLYGGNSLGSLATGGTPVGVESPSSSEREESSLEAVVIQGSIDTTFPETREALEAVFAEQFRQYRELTIAARRAHPSAGLVIWPETIFVQTLLLPAELESVADAEQRELLERARRDFSLCYQSSLGVLPFDGEDQPACETCVPLLTGVGSYDLQSGVSFNSIALIGETCEVERRYDKIHRVLVGEYLPFGEWFPWLYRLTPVGRGIAQGQSAVAISVSGIRLCPSICFESTVPHLIRRQVLELEAAGQEPDVLVNSTNDGWFFGTSCLDLHLACNVFRAVEMRKPMVVAANTGFSAWIDERGRILEQGPRRATGFFPVRLGQSSNTRTGYRQVGDWPWMVFGAISVLGVFAGLFQARRA